MFQRKKRRSLEHIASALVPAVAFTAVPNSPPPTPPPPKHKKKRGRKTPSPSPIYPALAGINMTSRAIGLSFGETPLSSAASSPERSSYLRDNSASLEDEGDRAGYSSVQTRGRRRNRDPDYTPTLPRRNQEMLVEAEINESAPKDVYAAVVKKRNTPQKQVDIRNTNKKSPRNTQKSERERGLDPAALQERNDEIEERQRQLEEQVEMQNKETREMMREVMARQHESSIRLSQRDSEGSEDSYDQDDNHILMDENSRLITNNTKLVEQVKDLRAISLLLRKDGKKGSPRTLVENIVDDNEMLKDALHRMTVELAKFQEKFGDLPDGKYKLPPSSEPKQKWLVDVSYLSPLFISYDAQLKEKEEIIKEMKNQGYHGGALPKQKWENLNEQNSLMVEEIQILMQQLEMEQQKKKETTKSHATEVAKLSKSLAVAEAELHVTSEHNQNLQDELSKLKLAHEKLIAESASKISAKEHVTAVNDLKNEIQEIKEQNKREIGDAMKRIKATEEDKLLFSLEITEMKAKEKQMQGQIDALKQSYEKSQDSCKLLKHELQEADKRTSECELHLADVLHLAEKTSAERDALAALVEKEQKVAEKALRKTMIGKWEMGKMEQTVKHYKKQAAGKMNNISEKIQSLEESHQGQIKEYHREMAHLRWMVQEKQSKLDDVVHEKKNLENELENVWRAATSENRRILDSLYKFNVIE